MSMESPYIGKKPKRFSATPSRVKTGKDYNENRNFSWGKLIDKVFENNWKLIRTEIIRNTIPSRKKGNFPKKPREVNEPIAETVEDFSEREVELKDNEVIILDDNLGISNENYRKNIINWIRSHRI